MACTFKQGFQNCIPARANSYAATFSAPLMFIRKPSRERSRLCGRGARNTNASQLLPPPLPNVHRRTAVQFRPTAQRYALCHSAVLCGSMTESTNARFAFASNCKGSMCRNVSSNAMSVFATIVTQPRRCALAWPRKSAYIGCALTLKHLNLPRLGLTRGSTARINCGKLSQLAALPSNRTCTLARWMFIKLVPTAASNSL
mmetsp:Transcript_173745/g.551628  ORF Transcript_173745/g.551628 Transcript_173745/m.551628 type:complete len:201 (-) Transcript_173745:569-1171(-)